MTTSGVTLLKNKLWKSHKIQYHWVLISSEKKNTQKNINWRHTDSEPIQTRRQTKHGPTEATVPQGISSMTTVSALVHPGPGGQGSRIISQCQEYHRKRPNYLFIHFQHMAVSWCAAPIIAPPRVPQGKFMPGPKHTQGRRILGHHKPQHNYYFWVKVKNFNNKS